MKYVIMCAGNGKRWGNFLGIPKHLVKIKGETLLGRTTRLLKKYGINDYIITSSDEQYKQYGKTILQSYNDCEVDRFEPVEDKEICYLYGDVYYTEEALKTIIETPTDEILFFGSEMEIFAVKIVNKQLFMEHKNKVKQLYLEDKIQRCIGWEVYKSLNNIPLDGYAITERFYLINDSTDDIDCPKNYLDFVEKLEGAIKVIKVEALQEFTLARFGELKNIERKRIEEKGKLFVGDKFECEKELADYLLGENPLGKAVVKIIEIIPKEIEVKEEPKPIKTTTKKKSSKK